MPRDWVRINGKRYCATLTTWGQYGARVDFAGDDPALRNAASEINRILDETNRENQDPNRELNIVSIPGDAGEEVLTLDWVYSDLQVTTRYDEVGP